MGGKTSRHGCLTAWLVLMIVANAGAALSNLLLNSSMAEAYPDAPPGGRFRPSAFLDS
jgi:hypothetical protein